MIDKKLEDVLVAYLHLIKSLYNSDLLNNISVRNIETEDAHDLLYIPVYDLAFTCGEIDNGTCDIEDSKTLNVIRSCSNSIWYSIDCRNDVRSLVSRKVLKIDAHLKKVLLSYFSISSETPMNIDTIHTISGLIELKLIKIFENQ